MVYWHSAQLIRAIASPTPPKFNGATVGTPIDERHTPPCWRAFAAQPKRAAESQQAILVRQRRVPNASEKLAIATTLDVWEEDEDGRLFNRKVDAVRDAAKELPAPVGPAMRDLALGKATLIRDLYPTWIAEFVGKEQTKDQGGFAVRLYLDWGWTDRDPRGGHTQEGRSVRGAPTGDLRALAPHHRALRLLPLILLDMVAPPRSHRDRDEPLARSRPRLEEG